MMISGVFWARSPTPAMSIFSAPNQVSGKIELRMESEVYKVVIAGEFKGCCLLISVRKTGWGPVQTERC
jgi:hypothetical protein